MTDKENQPVDSFGNTLHVGDEVVFVAHGHKKNGSLKRGRILHFTSKGATIGYECNVGVDSYPLKGNRPFNLICKYNGGD